MLIPARSHTTFHQWLQDLDKEVDPDPEPRKGTMAHMKWARRQKNLAKAEERKFKTDPRHARQMRELRRRGQ